MARYKYQSAVKDGNGKVIQSGTVSVYLAGTSTPASIYTASSGGTAVNSVTTDSNGFFSFWVDETDYVPSPWAQSQAFDITCSKDKFITKSFPDIRVLPSSDKGHYFPDADAADQGVTGDNNTIKYYVDAIGSDSGTIFLKHTSGAATTYTVTTSETIPSNVTLVMEFGAVLDGAGTLTINGPFHVDGKAFGTSITIAGDPIVQETLPEWWGAVGDGVTDDSTAINTAITHWLQRTIRGNFLFSSGKNYLANSALVVPLDTDYGNAWSISGYGAVLTSGVSSGFFFSLVNTADNRRLVFEGLRFNASGNETAVLKVDGGTAASDEYLYQIAFRDLVVSGFEDEGIRCVSNFFESTFDNISLTADADNATGYGMYITDGAGVISSLYLSAITTRYGKHGVWIETPVSDVWVDKSTFLFAGEEGLVIDNAIGFNLSNCHLEDNWEGAANYAAGKAGAKVIGKGSVIGCTGYNGSKQRFVIQTYATGEISIIGGAEGGTVGHDAYAFIGGEATGRVYLDQTFELIAFGQPPKIINKRYNETDGTPVSTSGTGEQDLMSSTVVADSMGQTGHIRVVASGTKSGVADTKNLRFYLGTQSISFFNTTANVDDWRVEIDIINVAQNSQRISWAMFQGASDYGSGDEAFNRDTSSDQTIKFTGNCANAGDTLTQNIFIMTYL